MFHSVIEIKQEKINRSGGFNKSQELVICIGLIFCDFSIRIFFYLQFSR